MKVTTYETLYNEDHGAYFEAQVWKKDSSIVPSLFFSHFFYFLFFDGLLWPLSFVWASLAFLFSLLSPESHSLHHPFLTRAML